MARRRMGKVPEHMQIMAHHPRLLRAYGHMELGQDAASRVDATLKLLAQIRVAMRVGCPY